MASTRRNERNHSQRQKRSSDYRRHTLEIKCVSGQENQYYANYPEKNRGQDNLTPRTGAGRKAGPATEGCELLVLVGCQLDAHLVQYLRPISLS